MPDFAEPLARLIQEIKRLPGIGQKSAQRIAFHVLRSEREDVERLAQALIDVKEKLGICSVCNNISDAEICSYCRDPIARSERHLRSRRAAQYSSDRDDAPVQRPLSRAARSDLAAARHRSGTVAHQEPAAPDRERPCQEVILATNPTVEGEATASYLSRLLKPLGMKVTRIAMGIPVEQRPGIRRRSHDAEVARKPPRTVGRT